VFLSDSVGDRREDNRLSKLFTAVLCTTVVHINEKFVQSLASGILCGFACFSCLRLVCLFYGVFLWCGVFFIILNLVQVFA